MVVVGHHSLVLPLMYFLNYNEIVNLEVRENLLLVSLIVFTNGRTACAS